MALLTVEMLKHPIVLAPMAGPGRPELAAAVSRAGGLGFLAAGYLPPDVVRHNVERLRSLLPDRTPFGVNLFVPGEGGDHDVDVTAYADRLGTEAARYGTPVGTPRWDDDHYTEKLELVCAAHVPVVSFTFGAPSTADVDRLHRAGCAVWATATTPGEARSAATIGVDAVVVQGFEAGGHRGSFDDSTPGDIGLLALLQLVRAATGEEVPLVATGGLTTGHGVAAVLAAGAVAAQIGTGFMLCPEARTTPEVRDALLRGDSVTSLTRAFTGRTARGIANRFLSEHSAHAPQAYPQVHYLTAGIRAAARAQGDIDGVNLWAGQAYPLAKPMAAADIVSQLSSEARSALVAATQRFSDGS